MESVSLADCASPAFMSVSPSQTEADIKWDALYDLKGTADDKTLVIDGERVPEVRRGQGSNARCQVGGILARKAWGKRALTQRWSRARSPAVSQALLELPPDGLRGDLRRDCPSREEAIPRGEHASAHMPHTSASPTCLPAPLRRRAAERGP